MFKPLKPAFAGVTLSALLMACTPAANENPAADAETGTAATSGMSGGMAPDKMTGPTTPFTASEDKMHQGMMQAAGADVQETYALKMIAHHRGAIEMSEVLLRETPDPELRRMAEKTIADQGREITMLEEWIAAHRAAGSAQPGVPPAG